MLLRVRATFHSIYHSVSFYVLIVSTLLCNIFSSFSLFFLCASPSQLLYEVSRYVVLCFCGGRAPLYVGERKNVFWNLSGSLSIAPLSVIYVHTYTRFRSGRSRKKSISSYFSFRRSASWNYHCLYLIPSTFLPCLLTRKKDTLYSWTTVPAVLSNSHYLITRFKYQQFKLRNLFDTIANVTVCSRVYTSSGTRALNRSKKK